MRGNLLSYNAETGDVLILPDGIELAKQVIELFRQGYDAPEIDRYLDLDQDGDHYVPGMGCRVLLTAARLSGAID